MSFVDRDPASSRRWSPPSELMRSVPRNVRLTGQGTFLAILSIFFVAASVPLTVFLHDKETRRATDAAALRNSGQPAEGEVTRLWRTGKDSHRMVSYRFTYSGANHTGEATAPREQWERFFVGAPIPIRFLPSHPKVNHPANWEDRPEPAWFPLAIGGMLTLIGLPLFWVMQRDRRLLIDGSPAAGVVEKSFRTRDGWMARYEFRSPDGAVWRGRGHVRGRLDPGAALCVLYNPQNPKRNAPYPMNLYRVADFAN